MSAARPGEQKEVPLCVINKKELELKIAQLRELLAQGLPDDAEFTNVPPMNRNNSLLRFVYQMIKENVLLNEAEIATNAGITGKMMRITELLKE